MARKARTNASQAGLALTLTLAALLLAAPAALAKGGDPDYSSVIRRVTPRVSGVGFRVLEHGNRMRLRDRHGNAVTIYGYEHEPYARILRSGIVQVNVRSPATYLNRNLLAAVHVPAFASSLARPRWSTVGHSGTFTWIDHRTHWMPAGLPPQVSDEGRRTQVLDYRIPVQINGRRGAIEGTLFWVGIPGPSTDRLIAAVAVFLIAGAALVLLSRRRRRPTDGARRGGEPAREAW